MNYAARLGRVFTEQRPEELRAIEEGGAGSMAGLLRADRVARAAAEARAADPVSRIEHAMARLHVPAQAAPPDYALRFIHREIVDGWAQDTCLLCSCTATEGHLASASHLRHLEDQALGDLLVGRAESFRNISNGRVNRGMYEIPTQAAALRHWGEGLTNLVPAGLDILRHSAGIRVDTSLAGRKRCTVRPEEIRTAELGLLKYCGSGKYFRNDFWYWHDLPTDLAILDRPAGELLADPALTQVRQEPPAARGHPRPHSSMLPMNDDDGWWPVLVLTLAPHLDWLIPESEGQRVVLVICFYQILGREHFA